jgi:hypothetical protein
MAAESLNDDASSESLPARTRTRTTYSRFEPLPRYWLDSRGARTDGKSHHREANCSKTRYAGVNIAGFDFGCSSDGTCNVGGHYDIVRQLRH